ncbi:CopG family transcriptional regulator [Sphingomonas sp. LB2R24]|uniref:CopG family transcriptional regulator n=1 Tax=Sphingomonas sorbitolis TaxID=3096165 RepID=UPI002FC7094A
MAITQRPRLAGNTTRTAAEDAFISGAPDAAKATKASGAEYEKGVKKGNKRQITLTIAPELLERVDQIANRTGQARAAVINMAIYQAIEGDLFKS